MDNIRIEVLGLSVRSNNALKNVGVLTVDKLVQLTEEDLYNIRNMGAKSVNEILSVIEKINNGEVNLNSLNDPISDNQLLPLCDDDYLVAHAHNKKGLTSKNISYVKDGIINSDISVDDMGFSARAYRVLRNNNCHFLSSICEIKLFELKQFKSLGVKSIDEIIEKIKSYTEIVDENALDMISNSVNFLLTKFDNERFDQETSKIKGYLINALSGNDVVCDYEDNPSAYEKELIKIVMSDDHCVSLIQSQVLELIKSDDVILMEDLYSNFDKCFYDYINQFITNLLSEKVIGINDGMIEYCYPSVLDVARLELKSDIADVFIKRVSGQTLESIGLEYGVTRERIRQKEATALRKLSGHKFAEDKYKRLFETYYISKDDFVSFYNKNEFVFNYLTIRYKNGSKDINDLISDESFPKEFRFSAERIVYKDYVQLGGKYIHLDKASLFEYILSEFAQEDIKYEDLTDLYYDLVDDLELSENEQYKITRGYENKCASSMHVLWKYPKTLRYYNIDAYDYSDLFDAIDLKQYNNVEISTRKIFNEHYDLMQEYDIRDEYELHNLLKKICNSEDFENITFAKMPHIEFGMPDRDRQVYELLAELSPIEPYDLAMAYEERYGVIHTTALSNHLSCLSEYLVDGVYSLDVVKLSDDEIFELNKLFRDDIYTIQKAKRMYNSVVKNQDKIFNSATLHQLGYNQYSVYIIKDKYPSSRAYFEEYLLKDDLFSLEYMDKEIYWSQSLFGVINRLKSDYTIIEYSTKKYINKSRIEKLLGFKSNQFYDFCTKAIEYSDDEYFTVGSLRYAGFEHSVDDLGFDEYFYSSLIEVNDNITSLKAGNNRIFKKGTNSFTIQDFIEWYIYSKDDLCIEVYDMIDELKTIYHLNYDRGKLLEIIKGSRLYYNSITDKIYADYDVYFDEI